jgi:hypothetical protein
MPARFRGRRRSGPGLLDLGIVPWRGLARLGGDGAQARWGDGQGDGLTGIAFSPDRSPTAGRSATSFFFSRSLTTPSAVSRSSFDVRGNGRIEPSSRLAAAARIISCVSVSFAMVSSWVGRQAAAMADTSASFRTNIHSFVGSWHCFVAGRRIMPLSGRGA